MCPEKYSMSTFNSNLTIDDRLSKIKKSITRIKDNDDFLLNDYKAFVPDEFNINNGLDAILSYLICINENQKTILARQKDIKKELEDIEELIYKLNEDEAFKNSSSTKLTKKTIDDLRKFGFTDITLNAKLNKGDDK